MNTVEIFCKNTNQRLPVLMGSTLIEIYKQLKITLPYPVIAARVNYKVEDLNFPVYKPKKIEFIDASSPSGIRVYQRTISMVMAKAVYELMPKAVLRIEHPICGGYYCTIDGRGHKVDNTTIAAIKKRMIEIIQADMPVKVCEKPTEEVIALFKKFNQPDRIILLETLGLSYARYFQIGDYIDYYVSVLAPSTGSVGVFDVESYENGILLRVPDMSNPTVLAPYIHQAKLFEVFNEFVQWNKLMRISNVGDFNRLARTEFVYNLIKISEALHEKRIAQIADMIRMRFPKNRFVMISGPSSSGKTTFSKRLSVQLQVLGIKPIILSMDNYFVNREQTPRDENGDLDFESIYALDLKLFNEQLQQLLDGKAVQQPTFNFETGHRVFQGDTLKIEDNTVLLIEGIHALNPELLRYVPRESIFRIYVSALTTISLDNHTWISTTDTRLIRRIVRDYKFRKYSAQETIARWPSVRRGEDKWIFPYQEEADVMFNSALLFELAVLRRHAEPILEEVPQYCEEYTEAHRLLNFLKYFRPIYDREIPPTSLLREFLGGSSFRY